MARTRVKQAVAVAAAALGLAVVAPAAANAGIYTWKYVGTYPTSEECHAAGKQQSRPGGGEADTYKCIGEADNELYLGYIW